MGPRGGPGDSDALPPAPRRPGDVEGGRPVARVSTVFTGSGDARARAFDAQSGALQRVFRGHALVINCIQVGPGGRGGEGRGTGPRTPPWAGLPPRGRGPLGRDAPAHADARA